MLSEKHTAKLFLKRFSYDFSAIGPYGCSRILLQIMVEIINNNKKKKSYLLVLQTSFSEFAIEAFFHEKIT